MVSRSRILPMTKWVCRWEPCWVSRGDTLQKAYLEDWEQVDDDQRYIRGEESKNRHRSCSIPRTTTSESLQTGKDDVWSATRELPAPRGCTSLPESSWKPFRALVFPPLCIVLHCFSHNTCSCVSKLHGQSSSLKRSLGRVALSRRFALDYVCDENVQQAVSFGATLIKGCRASGRHDERV